MRLSSPHEKLRAGVCSFIDEEFSEIFLNDVPKKWERFDDVAILPRGSFKSEKWEPYKGARFWKMVADSLGASRLALSGEVQGDFRRSGLIMLVGEDDRVIRRENGIDYHYRLTKCMFSAGNVNERRRMADLTEDGEVVVDLYAGIGYYSLPILVHSGVGHVHACEWGPDALEALRANLEANCVGDRCTVHEGDNRVENAMISGVADRVLLGLLPSSSEGYKSALGAIKPSGGTLHVHGLGKAGSHDDWGDCVEGEIMELGGDFVIRNRSLTKVKSHSPHWDHLVLDLSVVPA